MASLPDFVLRRLYVEGSLRNAAGGFEFQISNGLASAQVRGALPIAVDGRELPLGAAFFYVEGKEVAFSAVSKEAPLTLAVNATFTIWVDRVTLDPGPHKVEMGFDVPGMGVVRIDFTDTVAEG